MIQVGSRVRIINETNGDESAAHLNALVNKVGVVVMFDPDPPSKEWVLVDVGEEVSGEWNGMKVHTHNGMLWEGTNLPSTHWWMHLDFIAEV